MLLFAWVIFVCASVAALLAEQNEHSNCEKIDRACQFRLMISTRTNSLGIWSLAGRLSRVLRTQGRTKQFADRLNAFIAVVIAKIGDISMLDPRCSDLLSEAVMS